MCCDMKYICGTCALLDQSRVQCISKIFFYHCPVVGASRCKTQQACRAYKDDPTLVPPHRQASKGWFFQQMYSAPSAAETRTEGMLAASSRDLENQYHGRYHATDWTDRALYQIIREMRWLREHCVRK